MRFLFRKHSNNESISIAEHTNGPFTNITLHAQDWCISYYLIRQRLLESDHIDKCVYHRMTPNGLNRTYAPAGRSRS